MKYAYHGIDPSTHCTDCAHRAMNHYMRKGEYCECAYCDCKRFTFKPKARVQEKPK